MSSLVNKRLLGLLAALALPSLALAACGGDDDIAEAATSGPAAPTAATGKTPTANSPAANGTAVKEPSEGELAKKVKAIAIPDGLANSRKLGKDDAKVKLQVYEDFRCSHCLEFTAYFEQYLIDHYVKPGIVQIEFKYFPLGQSSLPMMVAAQCAADQGQFWSYGKKLFLVQAESYEGGPALADAFGEPKLKAYAAELKLDPAKFAACFAADATLDPIAADYREGQTAGVKGTPSFVINGKLLANSPGNNATWKSVLDAAAK